MQADWLWGLAGGVLIGSAAAILLIFNGRIMGASGIVAGLVDGTGRGNLADRLAFVAMLVAAPLGLRMAGVGEDTHLTGNLALIVIAGLLVGVGTRVAGGCTSGHGVCGISRLSLRGIVATVFYILAGGIIVLLFRHVLGLI